MIPATLTLEAIRDRILEDDGASFRGWMKKVLPHMADAYSTEKEDGLRSHLGASGIGKACARAIWYGHRWVGEDPKETDADRATLARMKRLWNRGHLEEGRFISLLLMIGARVKQQEANGRQMRFLDFHGHYAGSIDGEVTGVPDVPAEYGPGLAEFKTYNDKRFKELAANGVEFSDETYYVQCQQYMAKRNLQWTIFFAVNKNDEDLHAEILWANPVNAEKFRDRAIAILRHTDAPPMKLRNASLSYFKCKMCNFPKLCHGNRAPLVNCRTCTFGELVEAPSTLDPGKGMWRCRNHGRELSTADQKAGCGDYVRMASL